MLETTMTHSAPILSDKYPDKGAAKEENDLFGVARTEEKRTDQSRDSECEIHQADLRGI